MIETKNPFALREGKIITVNDLNPEERGLGCGCFCPACGERFEARLGDIRIHHFAHSGEGCDEERAYMAGLYGLLKDYLEDGRGLIFPALVLYLKFSEIYQRPEDLAEKDFEISSKIKGNDKELIISKKQAISFDSVRLEYGAHDRIEALIGIKNGHEVAIVVRPPDTVCKKYIATRYKEYTTVLLDFSNLDDILSELKRNEIFEYLKSNVICKWVYNAKAFDYIPKLKEKVSLALQKEYDEAMERLRKIKEDAELKQKRRYEEIKRRRALEAEEMMKRQERIAAEEARRQFIESYTDEIAFEDVKNADFDSDTIVHDKLGNRWVKCKLCGAIKRSNSFLFYGGEGHNNYGICRDCQYGK